jgi:hypothetical protein
MLRCAACSADLVDGATSCRVCGALLPPDAVTTVAPGVGLSQGRFQIGTTVAGRYRILGLVGRGGMGEVYRAHDVKLDQQVALKFLPEALGRDGAAVARFHNEVRVARQVTHPNVCRVHDIGEADGVPFISMEFVDGEDLASLLERIGRLPQDKGVEVAHELCAGLAAAHARGVLHRDLKPANIMLNRAGRVLIMDFGLAGVAAQLRGPEVLAGTPAYMAPEQLQGREVTARSDLYALGLVLYEMFSGARVFDGTTRGPVAAPSLLVKDLSPAIDTVILACLQDDAQRRPASAMAVAQALPGGDPVAAAMRAGQTPSPEMVAASRTTVRLSVRALVACFVAVIVLLVAAFAISPHDQDIGIAPPDVPPDVLVAKARDIAASVGYDAPPRDYAFGFERDRARLGYLKAHGFDWNRLANVRPGPFLWWYRQSDRWLAPRNPALSVTRDDPPTSAGEVDVTLDARSRQLLSFRAITDDDGPAGTAGAEPDWRPLFAAAGLDMARFTALTPGRPPAGGFDLRRAWLGSTAAEPDQPLRVDAAALGGRPVSFVLRYPWSAATQPEPVGPSAILARANPMVRGMLWTSLLAAALFVRRNYRLGRLDVRGAATLAGATFWLSLAAWLLRAHFTPTAATSTGLAVGIGTSLFSAGVAFIFYAGMDPYARRYWPASLVAWTRLVNGRLRDPLVGQDVLVGVLTGLVAKAGPLVDHLIGRALGAQPGAGAEVHLTLGRSLGLWADLGAFSLPAGAGSLVLLLLFKAALRRDWLAIVAWAILGGVTWAPTLGSDNKLVAGVVLSAAFVPVFWALCRFGMVATIVATWVFAVTSGPITWDPSLWYGPNMLLGAALILALAVYGLHTALAGRPLVGGGVFGDTDAAAGG